MRNLWQNGLVPLLLVLASLSAAWPWPRWLPEIEALIVRQNDGINTGSTSATPTQSSTLVQTSSNTASTQPTAASTSGSSRPTGQTSTANTQSTARTEKPSITVAPTHTTSIDPQLPAGGVSLLVPNIMDGSQYYRIGEYVTFAWNYTSLSVTPTAIDVLATCTANQQMYTIAMNQTITNATGAVTWDTSAYQATALSAPLLTEIYTLIIYDAASSISAVPQAGYLAVFDQYSFGMYTSQPYTSLGDFQCATCSGAMGDMEKRALSMAFGMACVTVFSFTWFVSGTGIIF